MKRLGVRSFAITDRGLARPYNEDNFLTDDRRGIWAVADGMGGHARGDLASATVIRHLDHTRTGWPTPSGLAGDIVERLGAANTELRAKAEAQHQRPPGTTVVCLARYDAHALLVWCGDSRAYRLRARESLVQLTRDHSLVQQLVDNGDLAPEAAEEHPDAHVLTRAIGVMEEPQLDFNQIDLCPGDRILLCSDGLSRPVPDPMIDAAMQRERSPETLVECLMRETFEHGAPDNVTIVAIYFD